MVYLFFLRPRERRLSLSRTHRHPRMLAPRRVDLRLGSALTRHIVYTDSPVCHADRRWGRSRVLASRSVRHVVLPALGAVDLCRLSPDRIAYNPVSNAPLFFILAASLCCSSGRIHPAVNRRHSRDVFSATSA